MVITPETVTAQSVDEGILQEEIEKLPWFPILIDDLMTDEIWELEDFQFGWFIKLIVRCARSGRRGYVPRDGNLRKLAGAKTDYWWNKYSGAVLAVFKVAKDTDGQEWLYNEKFLQVLREQSERWRKKRDVVQTVENKEGRKRKTPLSISISPSFALSIYQDYPRKEGGRDYSLQCIEKAIKKYMHSEGLSDVDAANFIHQATTEYRDSPAGRKPEKGGDDYRPYCSTWFNKGMFLDDRTNWYREKTAQAVTSKTEKRSTHNIETYKRTLARIKSREAAQETGDSGGGDAGGDAE